jgi:23S rRNA-/tRNA-specific pseudouridylate synthase
MTYKGFRFGVLETVCDEPKGVLDFVQSEIGKLELQSALTPLELLELGGVYVNDVRSMNPSRHLRAGDKLRIHSSPRRYPPPLDLRERITQENENYLIVDKPAGIPTVPEIDNFKENLISFLEDERRQSFFPVNALDTETSGLVVVAKSLSAAEKMTKAFAESRVPRTFVAFVGNSVAATDFADDTFAVRSVEERESATSVITELRKSWMSEVPIERHSRVEIDLHRGRPQDIRDAFARTGNPILGDTKNGSDVVLTASDSGKKSPALVAIRFAL